MGYVANVLIFKTKEDATKILTTMKELLNHYAVVSVADVKDLAGVPSVYADTRYGWTSLENIEIEEASNGFSIAFPQVEPIQ